MTRVGTAFIVGVLFALGLNLSGMTQPMKILGFLDITGLYTGAWDPSLITVMVTALVVHAVLYRLIMQRSRPVLAERFVIPAAGRPDVPLVVGSLLWGAGWGLTGLCPGPILAAVGGVTTAGVVFFIAMLGGMWLHDALPNRTSSD
jgi:uncharacterized membrane protein YedE/YeeE